MNKEWLAETHGLTLAEIEWAFAMTQTLLAFSDHPLDAQHTIITSICGSWTDHFTCSIQDIQTIWEAESHLTMQQINWLLQGLSSESASQQLMHALDMLQQIDTESDVAYWEAQDAESEEDSDRSDIVEDDQIQTISDNEPADGEIDVQQRGQGPHVNDVLEQQPLPRIGVFPEANFRQGKADVVDIVPKETRL